jgi:hypothetical protein
MGKPLPMKARAAWGRKPWERRRWTTKAPRLPPARKRGRGVAALGLLRHSFRLLGEGQGHLVNLLHVVLALGGGGPAPLPVPWGIGGQEEEARLLVAWKQGEDVLLGALEAVEGEEDGPGVFRDLGQDGKAGEDEAPFHAR